MNPKAAKSLHSLPVASLRAIDKICSQFEHAWIAGGAPRMEDYYKLVSGSEFPVLFRELLILDLEYRRRRGESPTPDDYVKRFPHQPALVSEAWLEIQKRSQQPSAVSRTSQASSPEPSRTEVPGGKRLSVLAPLPQVVGY